MPGFLLNEQLAGPRKRRKALRFANDLPMPSQGVASVIGKIKFEESHVELLRHENNIGRVVGQRFEEPSRRFKVTPL